MYVYFRKVYIEILNTRPDDIEGIAFLNEILDSQLIDQVQLYI